MKLDFGSKHVNVALMPLVNELWAVRMMTQLGITYPVLEHEVPGGKVMLTAVTRTTVSVFLLGRGRGQLFVGRTALVDAAAKARQLVVDKGVWE